MRAVESVADLRKESLDELGPRMAANARRLFGVG